MRKLPTPPRMTDWTVITILLMVIIYQTAPQQLTVSIYKLSLITMAAVFGYWIDRSVFPYARPDSYMSQPYSPGGGLSTTKGVANTVKILFITAQIRRAIIIGACILGVSLGT